MFRKTKDLEKFELRATNGLIGHVEDFYFDDAKWFIRYLVVNAGSWLNGRRVLISPSAVQKPDWEKKLLPVVLSKERVQKSPSIDTNKPVSRQHETALITYYGWPYYWNTGIQDPVTIPVQPPLMATSGSVMQKDEGGPSVLVEEGDPHLHSAHAVRGYRIRSSDGSIGHVDDFLVDDQSWEISHLVIDTRNWWPGKRVIVSPQWITEVNWAESEVAVDLTRDSIKSSPEFNATAEPDSEYIDRLHDFYGRPRFRIR